MSTIGFDLMDASSTTNELTAADAEAVRQYLAWINNPKSVLDTDKIESLQAELEKSSDPMERLALNSELIRAQNPDGDELIRGFVTSAKRYADEHNILAQAFLDEGVPAEVLRQARLLTGRGEGGRGKGAKGSRVSRTSSEHIRETALSFKEPFTINMLRDASGGSVATIRKCLDALVEENLLTKLGPASDWSSPGRPAHQYVRV